MSGTTVYLPSQIERELDEVVAQIAEAIVTTEGGVVTPRNLPTRPKLIALIVRWWINGDATTKAKTIAEMRKELKEGGR